MLAEGSKVKLKNWNELKRRYGVVITKYNELVINVGCQLLEKKLYDDCKNKVGEVVMIDDYHKDYKGVCVIFKNNQDREFWFDKENLRRG